MSAAFSGGFPFEIGEVWRKSTFQLDDQAATLFNTLETDLPTLELHHGDSLFKEDFTLLGLDESNAISDEHLEDLETDLPSSLHTASQARESATDVWRLDSTLNGARFIPRLRTWEGFEKQPVPHAEQTLLLSEARQTVFDAALQRIEGRQADAGVLPQDVLFRSLYNLTLGRSSLFFRWDEAQNSFVRTLTDVPISGYSAASSDSMIQQMVKLGTRFRTLHDYGRSVRSSKRTCTALIALKVSIIRILDGIEQHVTRSLSNIRSLLQLCKVIGQPSQLLRILDVITGAVRGLSRDEDIISAISDRANELVATQTRFASIIQTILARTTAPWLERLLVDLHLSDDHLHQRLLENEAHADQSAESNDCSSGDIELNEGLILGFVDQDDRALIVGCKQSLAALRRQLPEHKIGFPRTNEIKALLSTREVSTITIGDWKPMSAPAKQDTIVWSDSGSQSEYLEALEGRMSQPLTSTEPLPDELQLKVDNALLEHSNSSNEVGDLDVSDFNPVERLRPVIQTHARLINETVLRYIFWNCQLRDHLELQRQYHLFGNGDFVVRLSTALFSDETQSAERRRGNMPTGETMGLRLGRRDEQHWPPASSELRLTLAGILTETYRPIGSLAETAKINSKELPGGLSFSIRELSDDEIERVLDSGSLYALDFLRLQYHVPPGLGAVINDSCMQAYDAIFKQLLRMLRLLNVATKLQERVRLRKADNNDRSANIASFSNQAHHFVSVVLSHMLDVGIQSPWQAFLAAINKVETALRNRDEKHGNEVMTGLDDIRRLHEQCLDIIRTRLFLRQKYQKIRSAIEDVFCAILRCNASLENNEAVSLATSITHFQAEMTNLLAVLRAAVNRPSKMTSDMKAADGDAEHISLLFGELNWNGFYGNEA